VLYRQGSAAGRLSTRYFGADSVGRDCRGRGGARDTCDEVCAIWCIGASGALYSRAATSATRGRRLGGSSEVADRPLSSGRESDLIAAYVEAVASSGVVGGGRVERAPCGAMVTPVCAPGGGATVEPRASVGL
jgi:hypothetical protein